MNNLSPLRPSKKYLKVCLLLSQVRISVIYIISKSSKYLVSKFRVWPPLSGGEYFHCTLSVIQMRHHETAYVWKSWLCCSCQCCQVWHIHYVFLGLTTLLIIKNYTYTSSIIRSLSACTWEASSVFKVAVNIITTGLSTFITHCDISTGAQVLFFIHSLVAMSANLNEGWMLEQWCLYVVFVRVRSHTTPISTSSGQSEKKSF